MRARAESWQCEPLGWLAIKHTQCASAAAQEQRDSLSRRSSLSISSEISSDELAKAEAAQIRLRAANSLCRRESRTGGMADYRQPQHSNLKGYEPATRLHPLGYGGVLLYCSKAVQKQKAPRNLSNTRGKNPGNVLLSREFPVSSAPEGLTTVFGMGTGGTPPM
jgi:hypothetical protein